MIETCAVFFSLSWLAYLARYFTEARPVFLAAAIVTGILGVLTKATTFPAFAVLGGIIFCKGVPPSLEEPFSPRKGSVASARCVCYRRPLPDRSALDSVFGPGKRSERYWKASHEPGVGSLEFRKLGSAHQREALARDNCRTHVDQYVWLCCGSRHRSRRRNIRTPGLCIRVTFRDHCFSGPPSWSLHEFALSGAQLLPANRHMLYSIIGAVGLGLAAVINAGQVGIALVALVIISTAQLLYFAQFTRVI